jgi:transposase
LPPSVDEWLPENHLARFVVEVIAGLDLRAMTGSYRGSGSASYHPAVLLGIMVYGYASGVFSSRKLERATYDSVAFRFIAANDHPDHDTIAAFRRRFLGDIERLFVEVLLLAREMGMLSLGTVGLDGTKIHANASRHSALSYDRAGKLKEQLEAEVSELKAAVAQLTAQAEAADQADLPDGLSVPDELARREKRLAKLAEARSKIEARAGERFEREQAEHEAKLATREGKKLYALRKQTPEPVFGIIKSVLGFRQFSLRGLDKVRGEWSLVTLAWNIKRMFALKPATKPLVAPSCAIQAPPTAASDQANTPTSPIDRLSACFCRPIVAALRPLTFSPTGC